MRTCQRGFGFVKPGKVSANGLSLDWIDASFLPSQWRRPSGTTVTSSRADFGHYA
jgi:hypothetical protein